MSLHKEKPLSIEDVIPGGIQPTDIWHCGVNDDTCSRCCRKIDESEVPIILWSGGGENMLIYCEVCLASESNDD